jgi:hypothetical protein
VVALGVPSAVEAAALRDSALAYGGGILLSLGPRQRRRLASLGQHRGADRAPARRCRRARPRRAGRRTPSRPAARSRRSRRRSSPPPRNARRGEAERELLLDAEREARATAERAQARLQQLVSAGALLSRSLEEETTLAAIASVIVPGIADICRIDLLDRNGALQRS